MCRYLYVYIYIYIHRFLVVFYSSILGNSRTPEHSFKRIILNIYQVILASVFPN